ncbi:MAG: tRNA (N(6)-L-threonylcarbamoyladenosine(37)-C(2))-methylthiotransferase MtaB [Candidatus Cloacimonadaceae bacterium]|nr:tRNA (N(6)-L-threonylcarbamoyladenosine(37)-C(2))-methylthiotransferase MtaB [Candidatus Cloacimonadota bacterium]MCB5254779.1 tRNA (N(6)-L-threonylcarbamoyladenosine(37)-C(2))-methylthiotransferase MtaB [Candidatus Cloacimonadota bacterium]MCK9178478.1 tRNA (N(6)-L-threonylcarbamoyladenosine(37)-C(2))-methylthiotransferase MtaB [Candidatus Cloacimonadota bacterium]MCK9243044.1 tRNA (N(6)-L-threonylcarbamoyladenosine(37)-C(2))-methylthiotransferase MtaB [Candidatus Cloacimonadota bacterium]M
MPRLYLMNCKDCKIAISTLGCKVNSYESASIIQSFEGCEIVDFSEDADIYIINTCTVTNRSDYKSRNLIRKALKKKELNPAVKIVVTGCFAQRSATEIAEMGDIDYIIDNQAKLDIAQILSGQEYCFTDIMQAKDFAFQPLSSMLDHTRAFQKIQDGCDFYCSYCAIPYGRGHSRSARFEDVISQAKLFAKQGYKEIVLGGINIGLYRDQDKDLAAVVKAMAEIPSLELIRISSIEPQLISFELIHKLRQIDKLCPHFHIALQSGSDAVLQAMGRNYDTALVREMVEELLALYPDAAIGFDVICGFPGETEAMFEQTLDFLSSLPICYLHVFSFSKRKGTPADTMPNQVNGKVKTQRAKELTALSLAKKKDYARLLKQQNPLIRGVVELSENGISESLSDHYLRVQLPQELAIGSLICVPADRVDFDLS